MKMKKIMTIWLAAAICSCSCSLAGSMNAFAEETVSTSAEEGVSVTMEGQALGLEGVENARELGGYKTEDGRTVKKGMLLRTAKLAEATEEDIRKLTEDYNLGTVIDFRTSSEIESAPDPEIAGVENKQIHVLDEENDSSATSAVTGIYSDDPVEAMVQMVEDGVASPDMYTSILSDETAQKGYAEFFQVLLENEEGRSVLWHCTGGKDRAGTAAVLLLSALGVDEETILQDFALTNEFNAKKIEYMAAGAAEYTEDEETIEGVRNLTGVSRPFMENMIQALTDEYGSVTDFIIQKLGVSEEELETLQDMYLE